MKALTGKILRLIAAILLIALFMFGAGPQLARLGTVEEIRKAAEIHGIDQTALVYTEDASAGLGESYLVEALKHRP